MVITDEMIHRALVAKTLGDEHAVVADYISLPARSDPDWSAIGGYPEYYHPSYACVDWQEHIVRRILEAAFNGS